MADRIYTDIANGVKTEWAYDNADDEVIVRRTQDVDDVLRAVHREHMETGGNVVEAVGRHIGDVPLVPLMDYCAKIGVRWEAVVYGNDYNHVLKDFLRENPRFSTTGGKF